MPDVSILVVEDEPAVAEVVSLYLRRAGYAVRVVDTMVTRPCARSISSRRR